MMPWDRPPGTGGTCFGDRCVFAAHGSVIENEERYGARTDSLRRPAGCRDPAHCAPTQMGLNVGFGGEDYCAVIKGPEQRDCPQSRR